MGAIARSSFGGETTGRVYEAKTCNHEAVSLEARHVNITGLYHEGVGQIRFERSLSFRAPWPLSRVQVDCHRMRKDLV